jgi:OFA family oxalate/formate antiporter-like MFS transporter
VVAPLRLILAGVAANVSAGTLFAWSLVAQDAAAGVGASRAIAGVVFASAIAVFSIVVLAVGHAPRWLGPRRLLLMAAVSGGGGLILAASARGPVALWCGIALFFGAANGLAYGVALALAARTPGRRRGTATGVVVAAYAAGPVVLGVVAPAALRVTDWRVCLAGLGVIVAVLLAVAALLAPVEAVAGGGRSPGASRPPRGVLPLLWLVFAGGTAPALLLFAYAVPLAVQSELDATAAGLAVSALAAGNLTGRLAAGWWSDRVGRPRALRTTLGTAALSIAAAAAPVPALVLAGFLGTGLAYGAISSLVPAATADRVGAEAFSRAYGRIFTAWGCAGLLAPLAGEFVVGLHEQHPVLLVVAAAPLAPAGLAVSLLFRRGTTGART